MTNSYQAVALQYISSTLPWKKFVELEVESFRSAFESDFMGPLSIIKAAWPYFERQKYGRIVNFTSGALLGLPLTSTYGLTKDALFGLNKTLANEGAEHNITCNSIAPIAFGALPIIRKAQSIQRR